MRVRKCLSIPAVMSTLALLVASCGTTASSSPTGEPASSSGASSTPVTSSAPSGPLYGGTLVYADVGQSAGCNTAVTTEPNPVVNIYDHLALFNGDKELVPELAESWDFSSDGLTLTFNLRDGVKWQDGEPLTSADVKFTWESSLMQYHGRGRLAFSTVTSIDTPDAQTVVFHLSSPSPGFLFQLGVGEAPIIPKHIFENEDVREGPHATCEQLPVGSGPWKMTDYVQGDHYTLERNPDWWGTNVETNWGKGAPYLDKVIVTIVRDDTSRVNAFEAGEIGFLYQNGIPPQDVARVKTMANREVNFACVGIPNQVLFQINLRDEAAPWHDIRVRQAIAWAIDRKEIMDRANFGIGAVTSVFLAPDAPDYNPDVETYEPRDVDKANALLDEAGWPRGSDGMRFKMRSIAFTPEGVWGDVMKQQLTDVGIDVQVEAVPRELQIQKVFVDHDFDVNWFGAGINFPGVGVSRLYVSTNIGENPYNNASAYVNPEMDTLWKTYNSTTDPEVKRETTWRIMDLVQQDLPTITVFLNTIWSAYNTEGYAGFAQDCNHQYQLLRTIWSKDGTPTR